MVQIWSLSTEAAQRHAGVIKETQRPLPHTIHATSLAQVLISSAENLNNCVPPPEPSEFTAQSITINICWLQFMLIAGL